MGADLGLLEGLTVLEYLIDPDAVVTMLAPYPTLSGLAHQLRLRPSSAHPNTRWRLTRTRFGVFLAKAARATDPHARLRILENALTVSPRHQFISTSSEPEHLSALAELLLVDALSTSGFCFHDLPIDPAARRQHARLPDVMGTLPSLGTVCLEVYQPRDDLARAAYADELKDALEFADLPLDYVTGLSWTLGAPQASGTPSPGAHERHRRIMQWIEELIEQLPTAKAGAAVASTFRDQEAGVVCKATFSRVERWDDPSRAPHRQTVASWGGSWGMAAHANSVASRLESKGTRRQAGSRVADKRLLIVDCSTMRSFWDLALSPHGPSIDVMCDAINERYESITRGLDGLLMWAPYVPLGELRRVVLAAQETPPALTTALAGAPWGPMVVRGSLARLDDRLGTN
jgi:hypothetical protein